MEHSNPGLLRSVPTVFPLVLRIGIDLSVSLRHIITKRASSASAESNRRVTNLAYLPPAIGMPCLSILIASALLVCTLPTGLAILGLKEERLKTNTTLPMEELYSPPHYSVIGQQKVIKEFS